MNPVKFPYAKPVYGAAVAFLTAFVAARADGGVTGDEWLTIALGTLVAGGAVFSVTGTEPKDGPVRAPVAHGQRGAGEVELLVKVILIIFLVLLAVWLFLLLIHHI